MLDYIGFATLLIGGGLALVVSFMMSLLVRGFGVHSIRDIMYPVVMFIVGIALIALAISEAPFYIVTK